jgi:hypothetical protein
MIAEPLLTDAGHGIALPSGLTLARVVRRLLQRQRDAARANPQITLTQLQAVVEPYVDLLTAVLARYWHQGADAAWERITRKLNRSKHVIHKSRLDDPGHRRVLYRLHAHLPRATKSAASPTIAGSFEVFNPLTLTAIRETVYHFLAELNDTTADQLRTALGESLLAGETAKQLQRRLLPVFGPGRAFTVAVTESSRAVHAGGLAAAKESGVVGGKEWLASADACPRCLALAERGEIPLLEPFTIEGSRNPAYAVVWHPPLHPHCMCAMTEVL